MAKTKVRTKPRYPLYEDEDPDILKELEKFTDDVEAWLDEPNESLMGRKPRELIGTKEEIKVRDVLRRIVSGEFT